MGTAAHAFTLLHDTEEEAFQAQVNALGIGTTLLVDTFDVPTAVARAVKVAGTGLGAVRIDSGDLPTLVAEVRDQLDSLGATETKITVTNDLDEHGIAALAASPVDSYGVGTSLVTGSGHPAAGMVYKLVSHQNSAGEWIHVAKKSASKARVGGRKTPVRRHNRAGTATAEVLRIHPDHEPAANERELLVPLISNGVVDTNWTGTEGTVRAREHRENALKSLPREAFRLRAGDPVIPTYYE